MIDLPKQNLHRGEVVQNTEVNIFKDRNILTLWSEDMRPMTIREAEREMIVRYLDLAENNKSQAAKRLGISMKTLYNKLHEYGMMEDK